jgi:hypothetical protein
MARILTVSTDMLIPIMLGEPTRNRISERREATRREIRVTLGRLLIANYVALQQVGWFRCNAMSRRCELSADIAAEHAAPVTMASTEDAESRSLA